MGFEILGSDGVTVLKVDTTSQAARTTLYDQYDNPMSDVNSLGNILNGLNAATTLTLGGQSTVGVNVAGTTGTLTLAFEATIDNSTWFAVTMTPATGGATVTTTSADGQWVGSVSGYYAFRIRISAFTSGSMDVGVVITPGQSKTGAQAITTAGALTVEISDGTNGPANVTPPSTAATAAEEALVVALSPNSPLPTGSNIIGSLSANQSVNLAEINGTTTVTGGEAGSIGIGGLAATGSAVTGNPVLVAGTDGTYVRSILTDSSGRQEVVGGAASGSPVAGNPVLIAGSDGTDARTLSTDASGHPIVVGDGTAGSPAGGVVSVQGVSGGQSLPISGSVTASGTVTANQGTPNTVANSWTTEITDGTHGPAAVKAASTAAAAADPSLVVALSPNSPVPSGSNVIGAVTQSGGPWSVSGTVTVAQTTPANLQGEVGGLAAAGSAPVGNPVQIGGSDGTDIRTLLTDASGRQEVVGATSSGSAVTGNPVLIAGSDGTDARTLSTDASGHPIVVGDGTAGSPAGGVVSVQGVSGGTAVPVSFSGTTTVVGDAASGSPVAGNPVLIGGSDGTDARTISTDASGHPVIVGDGTAGSPAGGVVSVQGVSGGQSLPISGSVTASGTVTANQGTPNTVANSWTTEITDGTHGPAAVKAASTAAAAADLSLVVALSPNSPVPSGSNVIGAVTQSGAWSATVTQATPSNLQAEIGGLAAAGSAPVGNPVQIGGSDGTDIRTLLTDASGRQEVVGAAASGSAVVGNPVLVGGSDGTDARTISTDTSGRPIVVGEGTAGSPAGGVVSVQGVSGGQALPVSFSGTTTVVGDAASGSSSGGQPGPHRGFGRHRRSYDGHGRFWAPCHRGRWHGWEPGGRGCLRSRCFFGSSPSRLPFRDRHGCG